MSLQFRAGRVVSWDLPIEIGATDADTADRVSQQLEMYGWSPDLVRVVDLEEFGTIDLLVVRPGATTLHDVNLPSDATVLITVEDWIGDDLQELVTQLGASAVVADPGAEPAALVTNIVGQLTHANPFTDAVALATTDATVDAAPWIDELMDLRSAVGELSDRIRAAAADTIEVPATPAGPASTRSIDEVARDYEVLAGGSFDHESDEATTVALWNSGLREAGIDTARRVDLRGWAGAAPAPAPLAPPPPAPAPEPTFAEPPEAEAPPSWPRHLIVNAYVDGEHLRRALRPDTTHRLAVFIAVPTADDTAATEPIEESELPSAGLVSLDVVATCDELEYREIQSIKLNRSDRSQPSTVAEFTLAAGPAGNIDVRFVVLHENRPIQEAHLLAAVRAEPLPVDRVQLDVVPLSSGPEPRASVAAAAVTLEQNGSDVVNVRTGRKVSQSVLESLINTIHDLGSETLGVEGAPETLTSEAARLLLVRLAQQGALLYDFLDELAIPDDGDIALFITNAAPLLPLELVYDAESPASDAKICAHAARHPSVPCAHAGEHVVCPSRFWGSSRTIARTLHRDGAPAGVGDDPLPLTLTLYGATTRADKDTPRSARPTKLLEQAIARHASTVRVTGWREWATTVTTKAPSLLVVLGHTEADATNTELFIGRTSHLTDLSVRTRHVRAEGQPAPLVVLLACATAVSSNPLGGLPRAFVKRGAAAVVGTLSRVTGPQGAQAAIALIEALYAPPASGGVKTLAAAMTEARQALLTQGLLVGLMLVTHGEIDIEVE